MHPRAFSAIVNYVMRHQRQPTGAPFGDGAQGPISVDNLEAALRRALEKGDIRDSTFRRRVYVAAASALQRSAERRPAVETDRLRRQTESLTTIIETIERELQYAQMSSVMPPRLRPEPKRAPDPSSPSGPVRMQPAADASGYGAAPGFADQTVAQAPGSMGAGLDPTAMPPVSPLQSPPPPRPARAAALDTVHVEPRIAPPPPPPEAPAMARDQADPPSRSPLRLARGPFAAMFAGVVIVALLVMGVIWVVVSGAFVPLEARDTSVPNPPLNLPEENFEGDGTRPVVVAPVRDAPSGVVEGLPADQGWIVLFSPGNPTSLRLVGAASASIQSDPFGSYALLSTPTIDSAIRIDVPVGTLQRLAGSIVEVSLRARTDIAASAQISITCAFANLGDCGRRRFNLGVAETDFLFQVELPRGITPNEAGALEITTGFGEPGGSFRLLSAAIRATEG